MFPTYVGKCSWMDCTYDPVQVGKFIDAGSFQGGVDPAERRELTFTLATDSTF